MAHLVSIDNGGTFTDICVIADGVMIHSKTLTTPHDLTKCFLDVLVAASERLYEKADLSRFLRDMEYLWYSTTAGTNAMAQRLGPKLGLIVRKGGKVAALQSTGPEREFFEVMVGHRTAKVDTSPDALDASIVAAVNTLGAEGAEFLVVSLGGADGPEDEARVKRAMLRRFPRHLLGAIPVLYSHELVEDLDDRRRTWSALANAFLHPTMERFLYNAERELRGHRIRRPLVVYANDGSSSRVAKATAIKTHGSGPRAGLQAAAALASRYNLERVVSLDIGGTTTDVALLEQARIPDKDPGDIAGLPVSFRVGDVSSHGVGGSSVFSVVDGVINVGPQSVGPAPGPACFGRGGTDPTITDAYLLMGALDPASYLGGTLALDAGRAKVAITDKVAEPLGIDLLEALLAMEGAYNARVADAVLSRGVDEATTLLAFGGAGPMNACGVADAAGITTIVVPRLAAVFSAFGINFSDISHNYRARIPDVNATSVKEKLVSLHRRAERDMFIEGFELADCRVQAWLQPHERGAPIPVETSGASGKKLPSGSAWLDFTATKPIRHFEFEPDGSFAATGFRTSGSRSVLGRGEGSGGGGQWSDVPVAHLEDLKPGTTGNGPALIEDEYFTCRVGYGWAFRVTADQDIRMERG